MHAAWRRPDPRAEEDEKRRRGGRPRDKEGQSKEGGISSYGSIRDGEQHAGIAGEIKAEQGSDHREQPTRACGWVQPPKDRPVRPTLGEGGKEGEKRAPAE